MMPQGYKSSESQREDARRMYAAGVPLSRIVAELNLSDNTIRRAIRGGGIPLRQPPGGRDRPARDITEEDFDAWHVLHLSHVERMTKAGRPRAPRWYWWCRCACGTEKAVLMEYLLDGRSRSCGCRQGTNSRETQLRSACPNNGEQRRSRIGYQWDKWTIAADLGLRDGMGWWLIRCECGREREVNVSRLGEGVWCDCHPRHSPAIKTHGMTGTRTYRIWQGMLNRCYNSTMSGYERYGGKGVRVCDRWFAFDAFLADMEGECPEGWSIDRIDGNGNYEPGNCRWADRFTQANNRLDRRTIDFDGLRLTVSGWAERLGISHSALTARLGRGWPLARALREPRKRPKLTPGTGPQEIEYTIWCAMRGRCMNPADFNYKNYGARGIRVCERWLGDGGFARFLADVGLRPSGRQLDRADNDGHYSCGKCEECRRNGWPDNCRWATRTEQMRNRRCTPRLTVNGETLSLADWAERYGIKTATLAYRVKAGWPAEDALKTPVDRTTGGRVGGRRPKKPRSRRSAVAAVT